MPKGYCVCLECCERWSEEGRRSSLCVVWFLCKLVPLLLSGFPYTQHGNNLVANIALVGFLWADALIRNSEWAGVVMCIIFSPSLSAFCEANDFCKYMAVCSMAVW